MSYYVPRPQRVWKHVLPVTESIKLNLAPEAKILHFSIQERMGSALRDWCIWEIHPVDREKDLVEEEFLILGTGIETPPQYLILDYIGTVQDGSFVWHLFRVSDQSSNLEPTE